MRQAKLLKQEVLYSKWGKKFCVDTLEMPDGHQLDWAYTKQNQGGTTVIALDTDKNIILVRQFRYTIQEFTYENCAGGIEDHELPSDAAKRELLEETGYATDKLISLGKYFDLPSETNHWCHMFLALDCQFVSKPVLDDTEKYFELSVEVFPFVNIYNSLGTGKSLIKSSEHSFGIFLAHKYLTNNHLI